LVTPAKTPTTASPSPGGDIRPVYESMGEGEPPGEPIDSGPYMD